MGLFYGLLGHYYANRGAIYSTIGILTVVNSFSWIVLGELSIPVNGIAAGVLFMKLGAKIADEEADY